MTVIYNVDITSKAHRPWSNLGKKLVDAHVACEPSTPPNAIKVITYPHKIDNYITLYVGSGANEKNYRYIRVIIDIPAGSRTAAEKEILLKTASQCCLDYQKKGAHKCEVEVRINEVDEVNVLRVGISP
jgi:hypothetical protein